MSAHPARPPLLVGCAGFPVDPAEYAGQLGFVEVQETFEEPPGPEEAAGWPGGRELARALVAWQVITHPRSAPGYGALRTPIPEHAAVGHFARSRWTDEAWHRMDALARAVRATAILFRTPPSFAATAEHEQHLENFVAHADRPGLTLAWEADGWSPERAQAVCERLGLARVVDPLAGEIPDGDIVYLRAASPRSAADEDLARLADGVRGREGFVVFAGTAAWEDARRFEKML